MGVFDWLQRKSNEKSASNIVDGLRPLVVAVRADTEEAMRGAEQNAAVAAQLGEVDGPQALAITQSPAFKEWRNRKAKVADAQKKLFDDLAVWSNLAPERALNDVVLPALFSGQLVAQSDPSFGPVVVAAYRACEAAARQKGVNLKVHTPPEILQLVADAGDLYK